MKTTFRFNALVFLSFMFFTTTNVFGYTVDIKGSRINWMGSKVVGGGHDGEVKIKSAKLEVKNKTLKSVQVVVDMRTISNRDLTSKMLNKKLVDHLNSSDFFDTKKFPTSKIDLTRIERASKTIFLMNGTLTIKNQSHPVKLKAEVTKETPKFAMVKTKFIFDRTKFGIRYGSGSFFSNLGDKVISDDVEITVNIKVNKP